MDRPNPPQAFIDILIDAGLAVSAEGIRLTPLAGGVSSDIWLAETAKTKVCIKGALPKLKVAGDWFAPIERNSFEVAWMETAWNLVPGCCPRVIAHDASRGLFVMQYLEPDDFPVWKSELRDGRIDPCFAAATGKALAAIHTGTAGSRQIAEAFATDAIFHSIRLEPYLEATADKHAGVAAALMALSRRTAAETRCLVHGDVSPKNILVGGDGPKFLDAECVWYGDPAFDLAFCLNHLFLKCLWMPDHAAGYLACFDNLREGYFGTDFADPERERRTATLLPSLLLGRIDGKSPVEYLTDEAPRNLARDFATRFLQTPPADLTTVRDAWENRLTGHAA